MHGDYFGIDVWLDRPDQWLNVEYLENVVPFSGETGFSSDSFVPDGLEGVLFDPALPDTPRRSTFALLDAAAYPLLPDILETSDLRHKCLFTGKMKTDGADVAPWLVELQPDNRFTQHLMSLSEWPGGLWDVEPGIILKSFQTFDEVWNHCRKFTRIQDAAGKWLYYRYWSPPVSTRVMALGNRPELVQFVSPFFPPAETGFEVLLLNSDIQARLTRIKHSQPTATRPILTADAQQIIRQVRRIQQYEELIDITIEHVEGQTAMSAQDIRTHLRQIRDWYFNVGFWQRDHIAKLLVWEVLLGPYFVDSYANGTVRAIISSAKAPYEAIMNIEFFLEAQEIRRLEAENAVE